MVMWSSSSSTFGAVAGGSVVVSEGATVSGGVVGGGVAVGVGVGVVGVGANDSAVIVGIVSGILISASSSTCSYLDELKNATKAFISAEPEESLDKLGGRVQSAVIPEYIRGVREVSVLIIILFAMLSGYEFWKSKQRGIKKLDQKIEFGVIAGILILFVILFLAGFVIY